MSERSNTLRNTWKAQQHIGQHVTPSVCAGRPQLDDDDVAIAISNHSRQAIGFAKDQAAESLRGEADRLSAARITVRYKRFIDDVRIERPHTCPDLRLRGECADAKNLFGARRHAHSLPAQGSPDGLHCTAETHG